MTAVQAPPVPAVRAAGIVKSFGAHRALDGVDLTVPAGSVVGLLGANGAGKTTMVRVLTTLLAADAGRAQVAGFDVAAEPDRVRRCIGLSGQYAAVDGSLTGYENLYLVGRLYGLRKRAAAGRARELLAEFRLEGAAQRRAGTYSGGMRRRLDLAGALVARPAVVVLDEPTTGLDPRSRLETWDMVRDLVGDGTAVLLTTQYLEEADRLADGIVVLDRGRVVARGTADELKSAVGGVQLHLVVAEQSDVDVMRRVLAEVGVRRPVVEDQLRRGHVLVRDGPDEVAEALRRLRARGARVLDVGLHRPDLDDVFLRLTEDGSGPSGKGADR